MYHTHIVKLHRYGGGTSVVYYGFRKDCHEYAAKKNAEYQTDTYRVEPYQPAPWESTCA